MQPQAVVVITVLPGVKIHGDDLARSGRHQSLFAAPHLKPPEENLHAATQLHDQRVISSTQPYTLHPNVVIQNSRPFSVLRTIKAVGTYSGHLEAIRGRPEDV